MDIMTLMILFVFFIYGVLVGRYKIFPYRVTKKLFHLLKPKLKQENRLLMMKGYSDVSNRIEVDCNSIDKDRTMVILVYGQGNAANGGEVKYTPKYNVFNIFNGKCYKADDPLLGATDNKGSVWGRLADKIIENSLYENIIIKSIAVGGTPIASWTVNGVGIGYKGRLFGNYHSRILDANNELKSLGFSITHILWHQGESDTINQTTTHEYKTCFLNMLDNMRHNGIEAPIYVAIASRYGKKTSKAVILAQKQLAKEHKDIFKGPNTDIIDRLDDRTEDGQRFSALGLEKHANAWLESLKKSSDAF